MVKRVFTSIITVAVLMGTLVACGGNGESQTQETSNNTSYVVPCADFNEYDLQIKYRETPVDVRQFEHLENCDRTIRGGWWDPSKKYLVINLSGTNYHYCRFFRADWDQLRTAETPYNHYELVIRGNTRGLFDCRENNGLDVPGYENAETSQALSEGSNNILDDPCEASSSAKSEEEFRTLAQLCVDQSDYEPTGRLFFEMQCVGIFGDDNNCGGLSQWIIDTGDVLEEGGYAFDKRCFSEAVIEMLKINKSLNNREDEVELAVRLCVDGDFPQTSDQSTQNSQTEMILTDDYSWGTATAQKTKALQQVLGITADGSYGSGTRSAHITALINRGLPIDNVPDAPSSGAVSNPSPAPAPTAPPQGPCDRDTNDNYAPQISGVSVSNSTPNAGQSITFTYRIQSNRVGFFVASDGCNTQSSARLDFSSFESWSQMEVPPCSLDPDNWAYGVNCNRSISSVTSISRVSGTPFDGVYNQTVTVPGNTQGGLEFEIEIRVQNANGTSCYPQYSCMTNNLPTFTVSNTCSNSYCE